MDRYLRQIRVKRFGREGQERLARARVGIVGIGALGSRVAEDLGRAGVGYLRLIDRDWVEESNLHRQHLFDEEDARNEEPKAVAAARRLATINSEIEIDPRIHDLVPADAEELLLDLDLWIDGSDNFPARYLLNDLAVKHKRPWIYGACVGTQGMVACFHQEGPCLRCIFPEAPPRESTETCETAGILGPVAAYVTSLQSALALKLLASGEAPCKPTLFTSELWDFEIRDLKLPVKSDANCPACVHETYPALAADAQSEAAPLCGRNAVQISADKSGAPELEALQAKLGEDIDSEVDRFRLRIRIPEGTITVFRGGRAIVKGTDDPGRARALYDRYLGS